MNTSARNRQTGIALITVVFVMTLAAIVATSLVTAQVVAVTRTGQLLQQEQALWYTSGVENWAAQILATDRKDTEIDSLYEVWAYPVDYLPIDGGFVSGEITDQHGLFNVNDLATEDVDLVAEQLQKLIELAVEAEQNREIEADQPDDRIKVEDVDPAALVQAIADWIDADIDPRIPGGAEDDYYLGLELPYRTANQPVASVSELRLVSGMTNNLYEVLSPLLTALPPGTSVNVNTADPRVLAALVPGMTHADAQSIEESRKEAPFESVNEFMQSDAMAGREVDDTRFSVTSEFFLLGSRTTVGETQVSLYSLLHRDSGGTIHVMGRSRNSY